MTQFLEFGSETQGEYHLNYALPLQLKIISQCMYGYSITVYHTVYLCDPIVKNRTKLHIRKNQTNAACYTTVLLVLSLNFSQSTWDWFLQRWVYGDVKGLHGGFWHRQVYGFSSPNVQYWSCFISGIKEPAQPFQAGFLDFIHALPSFCTLTFAHHTIFHHSPKVSNPDTTSLIQLVRFLILIGWNF